MRKVRNHDQSLRIGFNSNSSEYYLRDTGGRWIAASHTVRGFDGIDDLFAVASKRYSGVPVVITATVTGSLLSLAIDMGQVRFAIPLDERLVADKWIARAKTLIRMRLSDLQYITREEYEAVRAILDAGELMAVPEYLASLVAVKAG
jgi:hypothetical protein